MIWSASRPGADADYLSGTMDVRLAPHPAYPEPAAFVVRTTRRLFEGHVLVKRTSLFSSIPQEEQDDLA